jgi:hypothetical protein
MSIAIDHGFSRSGKYIINHDIMNCTADGVVGNHLYSARALGISEPWDIIQLHPELKPLFPNISAHYHRIGLSHSENVVWNLDLNQLGAHAGYQPSVFYFGPTECRYWGDRRWLETVEYINSKNNFMSLAETLGTVVPATICLKRIGDLNESTMINIQFPCYLKASVSVSGVGIYRCNNIVEFLRATKMFAEDTPVQIQQSLATDMFLNLQYQIEGRELFKLAASEQILDGCAHQGNRVPASYEPWSVVDPMADWLQDQGMKGIFAFDVAVVKTGQDIRFYAIECNPRFNGATYPTLIAQKLNINQWSSIAFSSRYTRLDDLSLRDLEFNRKTGQGIVIVNWGTILTRKISILLAGTVEYQEALKTEIKQRL